MSYVKQRIGLSARYLKQKQTLFKRSAAGFDKVLIVWQNCTAARKQKSIKNILKVIFEVEGVVTQENKIKKIDHSQIMLGG